MVHVPSNLSANRRHILEPTMDLRGEKNQVCQVHLSDRSIVRFLLWISQFSWTHILRRDRRIADYQSCDWDDFWSANVAISDRDHPSKNRERNY